MAHSWSIWAALLLAPTAARADWLQCSPPTAASIQHGADAGRGADELPELYALTISGGVSLGAYEAGLNWAFLAYLRRAEQRAPEPGQRRAPRLVSVTGASAGSINSVLSALAWCAVDPGTVEDNRFASTWKDVGLGGLLPEGDGYQRDDALLSRAGFTRALERLRDWTQTGEFRPGCTMAIGIMVSRVEPQEIVVSGLKVPNQRFMVPLRLRVDAEGRPWFQNQVVDLRDPLVGNVMYLPEKQGPSPSLDDQVVDSEDVWGLIQASSAFPLAFSPRPITYCRPVSGARGAPNLESLERCARVYEQQNELYPHLGDGRYGMVAERADFIDGGVFDNVPLGVARALAEAPTTSADVAPCLPRVEYVYIDPDNRRHEAAPEATAPTPLEAQPSASSDPVPMGLRSQLAFLRGTINTARNYELQSVLRYGGWNVRLKDLVRFLDVDRDACTPEMAAALNALVETPVPLFSPTDCRLSGRAGGMRVSKLGARLIAIARALPSTDDPQFAVALRATAEFHELLERTYQVVGGLEPGAMPELRSQVLTVLDALMGLARSEMKATTPSGRRDQNQTDLARRLVAQLREDSMSERRISLSTRMAPLAGSFLGNFGAFLARSLRETDYYIGVYDGVFGLAAGTCASDLRYLAPEPDSQRRQTRLLGCVATRGRAIVDALRIGASPGARLVVERLAAIERAVLLGQVVPAAVVAEHAATRLALKPKFDPKANTDVPDRDGHFIPDQYDVDPDGDSDNDGHPDDTDNCVNQANPNQADQDADGVGDACDNCVAHGNHDQFDRDRDGHGDACDNCPLYSNAGQDDANGDRIGDACEAGLGWDWFDERSLGKDAASQARLVEIAAILEALTCPSTDAQGTVLSLTPKDCIDAPTFAAFLDELGGQLEGDHPVSQEMFRTGSAALGPLLLTIVPRQAALEIEDERQTNVSNPMISVLSATELGLRSEFDWPQSPLTHDASTIPFGRRGVSAAWRLVPYQLAFGTYPFGLSLGYEPTFRSRSHAFKLLLTPLRVGSRPDDDRIEVSSGIVPAYAFRIDALRPWIGFVGFGPSADGIWRPSVDDRLELGGHAFVGLLWDKLRLGVTHRHFAVGEGGWVVGDWQSGWLATLSITDLSGLVYWTTR